MADCKGEAKPRERQFVARSLQRRAGNLILWPILGRVPRHLHEFQPRTPRRGPPPAQPTLSAEELTRFLDYLFTIADRARRDDEALLRRQAVYLLGFDGRTEAVDWLRTEWHRAGRTRPPDHDIAGLLAARSASVALAVGGDSSHLYDFVDHMTDQSDEVANLNYWAYWIGELSDEQTDDAFMLSADTRSWTGTRLLQHLLERLDPASPHRPLNICTLHALIASRPSLLTERPVVRSTFGEVLAAFGYELGLLKRIRRTGWWHAGVRDPESVAEHTMRTAQLAALIAAEEGADPARAAFLALWHDTQETRTGDLPHTATAYLTKPDPYQITADQTDRLPNRSRDAVRAAVNEYESRQTPEALCAKDADKLEMLLQAIEYQDIGVSRVEGWIDSARKDLKTETSRRIAEAAVTLSPLALRDR